jgi:hypothetical protein
MRKYLSKENLAFLAGLGLYIFFIDSHPCFADFTSSLIDITTKVTTVILPLVAVIGMAFAAISLFTGNPNAKQHIFYAILGCIFGFGAQAIVDLISQTVH